MDKNQVTLVGNITRDPKTGEHDTYGKWAYFTVATTDRVNEKDYSQFVPCMASKVTAEIVSTLQRGDRVLVMGKIKSKKRENGKGGAYTQVSVGVSFVQKIERRPKPKPDPQPDPQDGDYDMPGEPPVDDRADISPDDFQA